MLFVHQLVNQLAMELLEPPFPSDDVEASEKRDHGEKGDQVSLIPPEGKVGDHYEEDHDQQEDELQELGPLVFDVLQVHGPLPDTRSKRTPLSERRLHAHREPPGRSR
jgi:hypothetical protein